MGSHTPWTQGRKQVIHFANQGVIISEGTFSRIDYKTRKRPDPTNKFANNFIVVSSDESCGDIEKGELAFRMKMRTPQIENKRGNSKPSVFTSFNNFPCGQTIRNEKDLYDEVVLVGSVANETLRIDDTRSSDTNTDLIAIAVRGSNMAYAASKPIPQFASLMYTIPSKDTVLKDTNFRPYQGKQVAYTEPYNYEEDARLTSMIVEMTQKGMMDALEIAAEESIKPGGGDWKERAKKRILGSQHHKAIMEYTKDLRRLHNRRCGKAMTGAPVGSCFVIFIDKKTA